MKNLSRLFILILILFTQVNLVSADEIDTKIIFHTFNGEYALADSLIAGQLQKKSNHQKYYYLRANLAFYSRYFGADGIAGDSLMQMVADYAQKSIDSAENLEETTETKFYLGSAYSLLSRALFLNDRSIYDGYTAARKGRNKLEDVIEEDPNFNDAYLGLAVLEYFSATRLSKWQKVIAWFLFMSGDKEKSLDYFKRVEEKGDLCKEEAKFILALMYQYFEPDAEKAATYIKDFIEQYPQNAMMNNIYRQTELQQVISEKGIAFLEANIESFREEYNIDNANTLNRLGYNFLTNNENEHALAIFQLNIKLFPQVANCYDSLGEAYLQFGNNSEAIKNYNIANQKVETDTTINEEYREFLRNSIKTQLDKLNAT